MWTVRSRENELTPTNILLNDLEPERRSRSGSAVYALNATSELSPGARGLIGLASIAYEANVICGLHI